MVRIPSTAWAFFALDAVLAAFLIAPGAVESGRVEPGPLVAAAAVLGLAAWVVAGSRLAWVLATVAHVAALCLLLLAVPLFPVGAAILAAAVAVPLGLLFAPSLRHGRAAPLERPPAGTC